MAANTHRKRSDKLKSPVSRGPIGKRRKAFSFLGGSRYMKAGKGFTSFWCLSSKAEAETHHEWPRRSPREILDLASLQAKGILESPLGVGSCQMQPSISMRRSFYFVVHLLKKVHVDEKLISQSKKGMENSIWAKFEHYKLRRVSQKAPRTVALVESQDT